MPMDGKLPLRWPRSSFQEGEIRTITFRSALNLSISKVSRPHALVAGSLPRDSLTPIGRECLTRPHLNQSRSLAELASQHGIIQRTARKWRACFRADAPAALTDRRSARRSQRRTLEPLKLQQAVDLRQQRCTLRRIARLLLVPITTLARAMRRLGLNRLRNLDPNRRCSGTSGSGALAPWVPAS